MSIAEQDFGFDPKDLVVIGKTAKRQFLIPALQVSGVTSAEWALFDLSPEEQSGQTARVTKTVGSGLALSDVGSDLQVDLTLDPADTVNLAGGDFFHRLDYVAASGDQVEALRGTGRLTPRV